VRFQWYCDSLNSCSAGGKVGIALFNVIEKAVMLKGVSDQNHVRVEGRHMSPSEEEESR
jgi:hypothetical protein